MATLEELLASVEAAREEIVALCQALVRVPSINTGVMPTGDETPAAIVLRDKLAADGIAADILESAPNRGNLIARLPGSAGAPRLLYLAHTDVVPVEDEAAWDYPPFGAEIHEGADLRARRERHEIDRRRRDDGADPPQARRGHVAR